MKSELTQAAVESALLAKVADGEALGNNGGELGPVSAGGALGLADAIRARATGGVPFNSSLFNNWGAHGAAVSAGGSYTEDSVLGWVRQFTVGTGGSVVLDSSTSRVESLYINPGQFAEVKGTANTKVGIGFGRNGSRYWTAGSPLVTTGWLFLELAPGDTEWHISTYKDPGGGGGAVTRTATGIAGSDTSHAYQIAIAANFGATATDTEVLCSVLDITDDPDGEPVTATVSGIADAFSKADAASSIWYKYGLGGATTSGTDAFKVAQVTIAKNATKWSL